MSNPFYTPTGNPGTQVRGTSAAIRAEFVLIQQGFAAVANIGGLNSGLDTGAANAYVVTPNPAMTSYPQFADITFVAANTNTGASTINASALGAIPIVRRDGSALLAGDIQAGGLYTVTISATGATAQLQANPLSGQLTGALNGTLGASVASASTLVLNGTAGVTGNYLHVTGAVAINAITLGAGQMRQVVFDSNPTLTNGASLILPGGANIAATPGDTATFFGDAGGVVRCVAYTYINPASTVTVPLNYIGGLTLSYVSTTTLGIAAGQARDTTNTYTIAPSAINKTVSGTWVAGNNNAGMGTGLTVAPSTWYHAFAIINSGLSDVYFDTSITAANKPAGTTALRYIGSFKTDASVHILPFYQVGQRFYWAAPPPDLNSYTGNTAGTVTLSTPPGIVTHPILLVSAVSSTTSNYPFIISSGLTGAVDGQCVGVGGSFQGFAQIQSSTNTSSQVSYTAANNNGGSSITTLGYINPKVAANN
ncbi:MAG TPA: hypothetical protein VF472_12285 [Burkholderiaceae bacterium]